MGSVVAGGNGPVLPLTCERGDIILWHGRSFVSRAIRAATGSFWNHVTPIIGGGTMPFYLEIVWRWRLTNLLTVLEVTPSTPVWIVRPPLDHVGRLKAALGAYTRLKSLREEYPLLELPAYLFSPCLVEAWTQLDPRGVCSAETAHALAAAGLRFHRGGRELSPDAVVPGDFARMALEDGWVSVFERPAGISRP